MIPKSPPSPRFRRILRAVRRSTQCEGGCERSWDNIMRVLVSSMAPRTYRALIVLAFVAVAVPASAEPIFSDGGPDAEAYGKQDGYPVGRPATARQQRFIGGSFSHYDELVKARLVAKPPAASPLNRAEGEFTLNYTYVGSRHTLDDYLARHPA